ncbi:MAG: hypothetical protein A2Y45_06460 [Tenericutes bacterium GWC2_34_14]|nr:MAG: hypothetical protein A2Y45_06460 [Tenericutes bacterium GWC2_34_14]OHE33496.1 MAG: hypothetical protein A2012_03350 [Tenericutes bacterium GWE2_34_108]OHE36781.1 MAG: hypothetical protein A2Y46_09150 [Tenericutes bacterium GWF1_35_14]OHE38139.1 MAG: hypothetical protein A2Y44_09515 [Tenericutes bacterium GWF2_35_184]OHE45397.1 MAG: hypothetical protein A3K26_00830 [Tenericutes bacterium RIFOXYA12_FULL_35_10]OHE46738.1 MAG: hypothetical protein A2308_06155 [Tenericutes bacterium RIFOXYB
MKTNVLIERKITKKVTFYKDSLVIKKRKKEIEILFQDIAFIKYMKNTIFNWLTTRTHGLIPGRIFIFLKEKGFQRWYSFRIPNAIFDSLPIDFKKKLEDRYRIGF